MQANLPPYSQSVWKKTNGLCWYCGVRLVCYGERKNQPFSTKFKFTKDHVIPKSKIKGLRNNLVPACYICNTAKEDKHIEYLKYKILFKKGQFKGGIPGTKYCFRLWLITDCDVLFYGQLLEMEEKLLKGENLWEK